MCAMVEYNGHHEKARNQRRKLIMFASYRANQLQTGLDDVIAIRQ